MTTQSTLDRSAREVADLLADRRLRVVFAESCTAGLVSATLSRIPGISSYLCGSAVVYQVATKGVWLDVAPDILDKPGPVSRQVASAMALGVLSRTPQADVAASVTGHLGPNAPRKQDGLVYVGVAVRREQASRDVHVRRHVLPARSGNESPRRLRLRRQKTAVQLVLLDLLDRVRKC